MEPSVEIAELQSWLGGAKIWLSGAVPEIEFWGDRALDREILEFVQAFAGLVFKYGGRIIHGSHPSLTPVLIRQAQRYHDSVGSADRLTLAVSRLWSKDMPAAELQEWQKYAVVRETPEFTENGDARDGSLDVLRRWMATEADVFVAVGGKWWNSVPGRAGVPREFDLAQGRGLPCFILGGFGGASQGYVAQHPDVFSRLRNGLPEAENVRLATDADIGLLAGEVVAQISRLPLPAFRKAGQVSNARCNNPPLPRFRILSLDGGGIRGAFSAAVLAALEQDTGKRCSEYFDLIVGTSTGGIIALGLGQGLTAADIVAFYKEHGPAIFPSTGLASRWGRLRHFFKPKHSHEKLKAALREKFGSKTLGQSRCRMVIPAYDANRGHVFLFKTAHHPEHKHDYKATLVDVALATSAAPTYFAASPFPIYEGASFVDGGVWANAPVLAGIAEAVHFLNVPLERIDLLSIGTTAPPFNIAKYARSGLARWNAALLDLMMRGQVEASLAEAQLLLPKGFYRIDVVVGAGDFSLDSASPEKIARLINLGDLEGKKKPHLLTVRERFLCDPRVATFEPYY